MKVIYFLLPQEWENSDATAILTYFILLISFTFNILIFCYIGELLVEQVNLYIFKNETIFHGFIFDYIMYIILFNNFKNYTKNYKIHYCFIFLKQVLKNVFYLFILF